MPLDRVIRAGIEAEGHRDDQGEYVPGPVTWHRIWAQVNDGGSSDVLTPGGTIVLARKEFIIRWRQDIATTLPPLLHIEDEYGQAFNVELIVDYPTRRRHIRITGIGVEE